MHHIYTSPSLILQREALDTSASFLILTRDLGLIRARAQGVRKDTSRLRGTLQEFSLATIAYVHGKAGWKITTAISERNFWNDVRDESKRKILVHVVQTLIRLIAGEENNPIIFDCITKGFIALVESEETKAIEALILVRLLHILGYVAVTDMQIIFNDPVDFSENILSFVTIHRIEIIKAINKGFTESQM